MAKRRTLNTDERARMAAWNQRSLVSWTSVRALALPLVFLGLVAAGFASQDLPVEKQYSLLTTILTYDRALKERAGNVIVIGILYESEFERSRSTKDEFVKAIDKSPIERVRGLPISYVEIDASMVPLSAAELARLNLTVLYVAPLGSVDVATVARVCRASRVPSMTGVSEYADAGVAVGILHNGLERVFRVNLTEAKEQGADFSSQFLKLAQVRR